MWLATSARSGRRWRPTSSSRPARAAPTRSCGATDARAQRTPRRGLRDRSGLLAQNSSRGRNPLIVGKLPLGPPAPILEQRVHRLPDREHIGMLVGALEPAGDPGEDLDIGRSLVDLLEHKRLIVGHEPQVMQGVPVPREQLGEVAFYLWPDPVGADDGLISHVTNYSPPG